MEELNALLAARFVGDVDVLKAAHHGARNGVTPGWLMRTKPEVVVISVGANNYGHPSDWTLRFYHAGGRRVYRTNRDGTVTVTVEPNGQYEMTTETTVPAPAPRASRSTMGGMGRLDPLTSTGAKLFGGVYALFAGLVLVLVGVAGLLLAPVFHHVLREHWRERLTEEA